MVQNLKNAVFGAYVRYLAGAHILGVKNFECEANGKRLTLRMTLNPLDSRQIESEAQINQHSLVSLSIRDEEAILGLERFLKKFGEEITFFELELQAKERSLKVGVLPEWVGRVDLHLRVI